MTRSLRRLLDWKRLRWMLTIAEQQICKKCEVNKCEVCMLFARDSHACMRQQTRAAHAHIRASTNELHQCDRWVQNDNIMCT